MIRIEHLSKVFRTEEVETTALNDVSLHVKQGEFVAIMGPSGCGKSTLLNIIGLLDNPTSGNYYFNGQEVGHLKEKQRTQVRKGNIGFVFQSFNLIDELNVYENIVLPIKLDGIKPDDDYIEEILKLLKLEDKKYFMPNQLSGGQQQRVALARALAIKPAIILADEPTGNLDSVTSHDVLGLLKMAARQFSQTLILITHDRDIAQLADRIVHIEDGKIVGDTRKGSDSYA